MNKNKNQVKCPYCKKKMIFKAPELLLEKDRMMKRNNGTKFPCYRIHRCKKMKKGGKNV